MEVGRRGELDSLQFLKWHGDVFEQLITVKPFCL